MYVITTDGVNGALAQGIQLMKTMGQPLESRAGNTLEVPFPVSTVYMKPWERVLFGNVRDANPFFHLMEAMWILAGREDVKFLAEFNKRMADYSDDGKTFNAPYGFRLRDGVAHHEDQLTKVIQILKDDPNTRQAICQIWDDEDLGKNTKDKACNMSIVFRVRNGRLCMTVYNRSNDIIWGAYGANVVQFSMIHEYVSAHTKIPMSTYTQVSNSYHVYTEGPGGELWDKLKSGQHTPINPYGGNGFDRMVFMEPLDMDNFELDLKEFFDMYDSMNIDSIYESTDWKSQYFDKLILPVLYTFRKHKLEGPEKALEYTKWIGADDWRMACEDWLKKRIK